MDEYILEDLEELNAMMDCFIESILIEHIMVSYESPAGQTRRIKQLHKSRNKLAGIKKIKIFESIIIPMMKLIEMNPDMNLDEAYVEVIESTIPHILEAEVGVDRKIDSANAAAGSTSSSMASFEYRRAMERCKNLTGKTQAQCKVRAISDALRKIKSFEYKCNGAGSPEKKEKCLEPIKNQITKWTDRLTKAQSDLRTTI